MMELNKIYQGDCLSILKTFPDESINCVVTSPPYWALRDYGIEGQIWGGIVSCQHKFPEDNIKRIRGDVKNFTNKLMVGSNANEYQNPMQNNGAFCNKCNAWRGSLGLEPTFELYIKHLCDIFDEVKRVLRKDGTCWVNMGDTYASSPAGNKEIKFEGDGVYGRLMERHTRGGTAEVTSKPKEYGIIQDKSLCQIPFRFSIEMCNRGWILRNTIIWHKPNCMPSSVQDRFTVDFEYLFFFVKSKKYWFERQFEPHISTEEKPHGTFGKKSLAATNKIKIELNPQGRNKRCVWKITTKPFKEAHFAVFPEELVETPIKSGSPEFVCSRCGKAKEKIYKKETDSREVDWHPEKYGDKDEINKRLDRLQPQKSVYNESEFIGYTDCGCNSGFSGGIVLDPFMGSGTIGVVAKKLNRQWVGIELNPEYIKMANKRINNTMGSLL